MQSFSGTTPAAPRVLNMVCKASAGVLFSCERWQRQTSCIPPGSAPAALPSTHRWRGGPGWTRCGSAGSRDTARCGACGGRSCFPMPPVTAAQGLMHRRGQDSQVGGNGHGLVVRGVDAVAHAGHVMLVGNIVTPKSPTSSSPPDRVRSSQVAGTMPLASRKSSVSSAPYTGSGFFLRKVASPLTWSECSWVTRMPAQSLMFRPSSLSAAR